jgi:hypothetical protein
MKRLLGSFLGFVVAGSLLGGCIAVVDPYPGVYAPGPRIVVAPPPVVVAPNPRGWYGHRGYGWQRRGHR